MKSDFIILYNSVYFLIFCLIFRDNLFSSLLQHFFANLSQFNNVHFSCWFWTEAIRSYYKRTREEKRKRRQVTLDNFTNLLTQYEVNKARSQIRHLKLISCPVPYNMINWRSIFVRNNFSFRFHTGTSEVSFTVTGGRGWYMGTVITTEIRNTHIYSSRSRSSRSCSDTTATPSHGKYLRGGQRS